MISRISPRKLGVVARWMLRAYLVDRKSWIPGSSSGMTAKKSG
jgi:hypothetical protein